MPPPRQPHDPFTDAPIRTSNPTTTTSSRAPPRPHAANLFAHSLSRRPTSRTTTSRGVEPADLVRADSDSETDLPVATLHPPRQTAPRILQQGSPETSRHARSSRHDGRKNKTTTRGANMDAEVEQDAEMVNRRADGSYLLGLGEPGLDSAQQQRVIALPWEEDRTEGEEERAHVNELDGHYATISRRYLTSGGMSTSSSSGRGGNNSSSNTGNSAGGKKNEEELDSLRVPMMARLREQVAEKLISERWMFEGPDRYTTGLS